VADLRDLGLYKVDKKLLDKALREEMESRRKEEDAERLKREIEQVRAGPPTYILRPDN
jgi:hypothetical protein